MRAMGLDRVYLESLAIVLTGLGLELAVALVVALTNEGRLARWSTATRLVQWAPSLWAACTACYCLAWVVWSQRCRYDRRRIALAAVPMGVPVAATLAYGVNSSSGDLALFAVGGAALGYLTFGPPLVVAAWVARRRDISSPGSASKP